MISIEIEIEPPRRCRGCSRAVHIRFWRICVSFVFHRGVGPHEEF